MSKPIRYSKQLDSQPALFAHKPDRAQDSTRQITQHQSQQYYTKQQQCSKNNTTQEINSRNQDGQQTNLRTENQTHNNTNKQTNIHHKNFDARDKNKEEKEKKDSADLQVDRNEKQSFVEKYAPQGPNSDQSFIDQVTAAPDTALSPLPFLG